MKLWLISQTANNKYDTYDSAVVAAETADEAQRMHPAHTNYGWEKDDWPDWAYSPEQVTVELVGEAAPGMEAGPICASYNAG